MKAQRKRSRKLISDYENSGKTGEITRGCWLLHVYMFHIYIMYVGMYECMHIRLS